MAECHPVGFQWVMEAKERGAKIIHVDPRFTRTSASADLHVPIRAGSDIAFLGGIVNHILENGREFREYVARYTNAGTIINEDFADTEDLDGLFSGWDDEAKKYDISSWQYAGMEVRSSAGQRNMAAQGEAHRRPSRRRHPGSPGPRQHPGLDRRSHPLRPPPRVPADAPRRLALRPAGLHRERLLADRLLGPHRRLHRQPAQGLVRRGRQRGERV